MDIIDRIMSLIGGSSGAGIIGGEDGEDIPTED